MGLYTSTGAFNVALNDTTGKGRYSASGALRINLVSGSSYVGLYAADGALNVVDVSGISISTYGGLYHPSGALRGRTAPTTFTGLQAPDGSYYFDGLFSPLNLFSAGEQGVWYDPSDFSTMFQDSAGTTPVTAVEQPVGLLLDKSKGLAVGSDVIVNGSFSSDTVWTKDSGWTISGGAASCDGSAQFSQLQQTGAVTLLKWYKVTLTLVSKGASVTNIRIVMGGSFVGQIDVSATGTYSGYFFNSGASMTFSLQTQAGTGAAYAISIDNVSAVEIAGNHASQSTSTSRPTLSARVNLLTYSEVFSSWSSTGVGSISSDTSAAPNGTTTADTLNATAATGAHGRFQSFTYVAAQYTFSICAKAGTYNYIAVDFNNTANQGAVFDLSNGTIGFTDSNVTSAIDSLGSGWYRCSVTRTMAAGAGFPEFYLSSSRTANGRSFAATGTETVIVWGADLRPANAGVGLPAYQRVGAATDYDTTGFPYYLSFDGVDDALASASINFTSTNKMSVFAGVRKLSDAALGTIAELGTSFAGSFSLFASYNPAANYAFGTSASGSVYQTGYTASNYSAPISNVISGSADLSQSTLSNQIKMQINGSAQTLTFTGAGTPSGSFMNGALHVGSRGGSSIRFNGHLYSFIVRGAATDAATITATETWVNGKTMAY